MSLPSAAPGAPEAAADATRGQPRIVAVPVGPSPAGFADAAIGAGIAPAQWLLHDVAASRRLEASAAAALPAHTLMRRAGLAVARLAQAVAPHASAVTILAGPGNNGGDGFEAALHLHRLGREVGVHFLGDAARLPADALASLRRARDAGVPIQAWSEADGPTRLLRRPATLAHTGSETLLIDALLGRGLTRPAEGAMAGAIEAINRCGAPVLAVDLPSGLPGDTGTPASGAAVVHAQTTLALLSLAPGLFTGLGRELAGRIWWDDLGVDGRSEAAVARLTDPAAGLAAAPRRHGQHKGSFGDLRIVAGAPSMTGAALLAGRAALRAGAGRVYVHLLDEAAPAYVTETSGPEASGRNPLVWKLSLVDDGIGLDSATASYRVVDAMSAAVLLDWRPLPPGTPVLDGMGAVIGRSYTVPLHRRGTTSIAALANDGLYRIELRGADRLGREVAVSRCWNHRVLTAPLHVLPGGPPTNGAGGKWALTNTTLNLATVGHPIGATVNLGPGVGLMEFPVVNPTGEPVALTIDFEKPASGAAQYTL
ncbi:MAG TPA: NAD(P)H-hydrate epimerase, partial [Burkholderiaceae bacterium]|nr:NAD(P)H-hydrate epimerase [Burkholderiaceae bacterium]